MDLSNRIMRDGETMCVAIMACRTPAFQTVYRAAVSNWKADKLHLVATSGTDFQIEAM